MIFKRFKDRVTAIGRRLPETKFGAALLGVAFTSFCGLLLAKLGTSFFGDYGWSLFVALPFFCGFTSVFLYS